MNPSFLQEHPEGVILAVKVQPRASRNEVVGILGDELKIKITAPPVDSAANEALLRFLADTLDCPRGAVRLLRGNTSRRKTILIQGMKPLLVLARLGL